MRSELHYLHAPLDVLRARLAARNAMRPVGTFRIDESYLATWSNLFEPPDADELRPVESGTASSSMRAGQVVIVPHQSAWVAQYSAVARTLSDALGTLALRIDHIGSTAVPGLNAKDIIDVQISVARLDESVDAALRSAGFRRIEAVQRDHRPPGVAGSDAEWEKWFYREPPDVRRTHIHVRVMGRSNQRYPLLFRDYLIAHPDTTAAYGILKHRLAASLANADDYPDVKDPAVDLIYLAAQEWANSCGWQGADNPQVEKT